LMARAASEAGIDGRVERHSYARIPTVLEAPNLVQIQLDSFRWFHSEGLQELFNEISPIQDYNQKSMDLGFPATSSRSRATRSISAASATRPIRHRSTSPPRCW
jgi:DNA-directed RNA polymerase beta subunit